MLMTVAVSLLGDDELWGFVSKKFLKSCVCVCVRVVLCMCVCVCVCVDIDECSLGIHNCPSTRNCTNTAGGFRCSCPDMFFPVPADPDRCIRKKETLLSRKN